LILDLYNKDKTRWFYWNKWS